MRKHIAAYVTITTVLLVCSCLTKNCYFNHPYPNIEEYTGSFVLIVYTLISLIWKKDRLKKAILGGGLAILFFLLLNLINHLNEWHPTNLRIPFSSSQSFHVDHTPFEWPEARPEKYGYSTETLDKYYSKLDKWKRLRGLVVIKDNKLIIEKYLHGTTKNDAFNVHSVTKSITSALIGIGIDKGVIPSEEEKVMNYFPEYQSQIGPLKSKLTIKHLLTMQGGFQHWDDYSTPKECLVDIKINKEPGTNFKYFTGSQAILSAIISKSSGQTTKDFAHDHFLRPIGIKNAFWRLQDGYYCGGGESYYTARDLARIGQTYLNKGRVGSKQVVSEAWIEKSLTNYAITAKDFRTLHDYSEVGYGYCWWLLDYQGHEIYTARGKGGQYLMIIPEINAVIVIIQEWNLKKNFDLENKLICDLLYTLLNGKDITTEL